MHTYLRSDDARGGDDDAGGPAPSSRADPGDIDLWLTSYEEIVDPRLHDAYLQLLSPAEREQRTRFHQPRDRLRYLVTRALVRTVLSRYLPVREADWIFEPNAYGRPRIANAGVGGDDLRFNVSHTHSLIALAVTRGREVGVDVENIRAPVDIAVADQFFAPAEVAALRALPAARQHFRFFEHWTFKESYIKARGMGLSIPLDRFGFDFPSDRHVRISIDAELADDEARWQFWQFRPGSDYLVAVCAERVLARPARLFVRKIVPGAAEHALSPAMTRSSEFLKLAGIPGC